MKKPFHVRYNPYTESIEVLDNAESVRVLHCCSSSLLTDFTQLRDLASSIKSDISALAEALNGPK